jgi:hypothetical protein
MYSNQLKVTTETATATAVKTLKHNRWAARSEDARPRISYPLPKAYLELHLLEQINFVNSPVVRITDWHEKSSEVLLLRKMREASYLVTLQGDCYFEVFPTKEEAVKFMLDLVDDKILAVAEA